VLLVLATAWALVPAFVDLRLGFPQSWVTVGLAALAWLLTLFAWLESLDTEFTVWPLLGFLTATAILVVAGLALIPEIRNRPALPSGVANAAQWANQPALDFGQRPGGQQPSYGQQAPGQQQPYGQPGAGQRGPGQGAGQGYGQPGQPGQPYGQPGQQPYSPPPPPPPAATPPPPPAGGSTASGEGSGTPGSGERPPA
jgi:hypothetical protein